MATRIFKFLVLVSFLFLLPCGIKAETGSFIWSELPALPPAYGSGAQAVPAVPFAGIHNGALLVAGGVDVYVLYNVGQADAKWEIFKAAFPRRAAHGVSIDTPAGIVCIGGKNETTHLAKVTRMSWDAGERNVIFTEMPDLPYTNADMGGALIDNKIYVLGGYIDGKPGTSGVYLDLANEKAGWQPMPAIPGVARLQPAVAAQNAGDETCLYVFGGYGFDAEGDVEPSILTDTYCFVPSKKRWEKMPDIAIDGKVRAVAGATALPMGTGHILLSGGVEGDISRFNRELWAYHTVTGTWFTVASVPWQTTVG